jgi:hypothetical protein
MEQPIEIVIRKTDGTAQQPTTQTPSSKKGKTSVKDQAVNTALINAGKQILSYGISQYGNITGNTIKQRQMNDAITIAGYMSQIAIGGVVGAVSVATQIGLNAVSNAVETNKANRQAELLYQRSGNATINGGRGTND